MLRTNRRSLLLSVSALSLSGLLPSMSSAAENLPAKWDLTRDVVIIGSGLAGMSAAAEACAAKASVVVLEKMRVAGGNSAISGGGFACWTDNQHLREKYNLGQDSADLHYQDTLKGGDFYNLPELVRVLADEAPSAMNWMLDEGGLTLNPGIGRVGGHSAYRDHMATGARYLAAVEAIAKKHGFKDDNLLKNHEAVKLWKDNANGRIVGVQVKTRQGIKNIRAVKGVVLATGGFARDVKFRMRYVPTLTEAYNSTNQPGATGDSLMMALDAGADALHLAFIQLFPTAEPTKGSIDRPALFPIQFPGFGAIYVSEKGERFVSELERRDVVSQAEIATGGKRTWCVFNEEVYSNLTDKKEIDQFVANGRVKMGATIEALASEMKVPAEALSSAIEKHNQALAQKKDADFGKPVTGAMKPMTKGPYYAVAQWPSVHHCQGGVRIDTNAQVIDVHGKPIPGLYAAGEFVGGIHGNNRLGGNALADCVVFGRIAGKRVTAD